MEELEIKEEKDAVRKDILLQKYGIIAPKLTQQEKADIEIQEAADRLGYRVEWRDRC